MPAAKNAKRTADAQAKSSAAKKAKKTPVEKKIDTVMEALTNEETVVPGSESCRSMLIAAATPALKTPKDVRHEDQNEVLGMLMEVFDTEKGRWEARVADATGIFEKATMDQKEKMDAKDAADAELKAQKDVVRTSMEAQSKAAEVVEECNEEFSAACKQREDAKAKKETVVKTRENDVSLQETLKGLKEGIYENPKELKKHITAIGALFEGLGAEEALLKTLPQILRRQPSERGSFDEMALQQLDTYLDNHLSSLNSQIEAADAIVAEHEIAATAWSAAVEVAEDKKRESDEALQGAEAHQTQLQEALNSARKVLKEYTAAVKSRDTDKLNEECGLGKAEEVLECLKFLQDYIVPAPEEEAKEVAVESTEASTVADMPMDVTDAEEKKIIPTANGKDVDVHMNLGDVPSPSKHARRSLGADNLVVAV